MKFNLPLLTLLGSLSVFSASADTLSQWTFEASLPNASAGAGAWITNLTAEAGFTPGVASGLHAAASVYSNPVGNGSAESFSATAWAVGDFYQFVLPTTGYQDIGVSFDQTSSGTGPRDFSLNYSTDGINFTLFGTYQVLANAAPNPTWSAGTPQGVFTSTFDLSAVSAIENTSTVYFRLIDTSTTSAAGGTVAAGGTSRVDNFTVTATAVPEPASAVIFGVSGLLALVAIRRRR